MSSDTEFKRAIETIKLRAPIEDVVRERVPGLRKAGALWVACCPFHEEKTPSFKVDPRRGSWRCYGACSEGGDQLSFLQKIDNLGFRDALEILAARTGIELPRSSRARSAADQDPLLDVLAEADAFYQSQLITREGRAALEYLRARGLEENTCKAFGIGYSPAAGQALVGYAREADRPFGLFEKAGLCRTNDRGRPYDFFRGRLMIPIRDEKGRTVGFGARRLADGDEGSSSGPKYINSADSPLFHKGRLIYGLDRALEEVRRSGRLVLVEGYTDVMAAHQVGLANVCAVLGTSTTEDHAGLVRRAGARHVSLVFDGDEAGRKAAFRALEGLLPLDVELAVVELPEGRDPCDLLLEEGSQPFLAAVEHATRWFDFVVAGLEGLTGAELAREVDRVFELFRRVRKPVHRESLVRELSSRLDLPLESLRAQWQQLPGNRRRQAMAPVPADLAPQADSSSEQTLEPRRRQVYMGMIGAVLLDPSLIPLMRPHAEGCPDAGLAAVIHSIFDLYEDVDATIDQNNVMISLGEHPARGLVVPCVDYALTAEDPKTLLDGEIQYLKARERKLELSRKRTEMERAEREGRESDALKLFADINELQKQGS